MFPTQAGHWFASFRFISMTTKTWQKGQVSQKYNPFRVTTQQLNPTFTKFIKWWRWWLCNTLHAWPPSRPLPPTTTAAATADWLILSLARPQPALTGRGWKANWFSMSSHKLWTLMSHNMKTTLDPINQDNSAVPPTMPTEWWKWKNNKFVGHRKITRPDRMSWIPNVRKPIDWLVRLLYWLDNHIDT